MEGTNEIEKAILGAILLESEALNTVLSILHTSEIFDEPNNKQVYEAILNLYKRNSAVDIITVTHELKSMNVLESIGGAYYVSALTNRVASSANIEFHARIIQQEYIKRSLVKILQVSQYKINEPNCDPFFLINKIEKAISDLLNGVIKKELRPLKEILDELLIEFKEVLKTGKMSGIECGIEELNLNTNGWQNGDLIVVAGRPSMGKTAAAMNFALFPARQGKAVAVFSLEMSEKSLASRLLSVQSNINVQKIVHKILNQDEVNYLEKESSELNIPIFIDDTPQLTLYELRNKARQLKRKHNIELIIIDYLQLMAGEEKNREEKVSNIVKGLKALAKELDLPIIVLSQLNRQMERDIDRRPQLSHLRESGEIEQSADMVIFCYRPIYYQIESYEYDGREIPTKDLFVFIISKFRNGAIGEIIAQFIGSTTMLKSYNH